MASTEPWLLENGNVRCLTMEMKHVHVWTAHNMPSSSLRKKSDLNLVSKVRQGLLRNILVNLQEVLLGTKLSILFLAIPFAVAAECKNFGRPWVFALSLLGLTPLTERVSFLTEQITFYTGPTVGRASKCYMWKCYRVDNIHICSNPSKSRCSEIQSTWFHTFEPSFGSWNLSFLWWNCDLGKERKFDRKQVDVNVLLLLLGLLCHVLPLMLRYAGNASELTGTETLVLSRASCIVMLIAYISYLVFQLCSHRKLFEASQDDVGDSDVVSDESAVIGFWSAFVWLVLMTGVIALLSEYVVGTIEAASDSWGLPSVSSV